MSDDLNNDAWYGETGPLLVSPQTAKGELKAIKALRTRWPTLALYRTESQLHPTQDRR